MKTDYNSACEEFQKHFDPFELSSSHLSESQQTLSLAHTTTCPGCERWVKDWELITRSARKMPQLEVPTSVLTNVMSVVQPTTSVGTKEQMIQADVIWLIAGFGALLLASTCLGADSSEGVASWSLSFVIVVLINRLLKSGAQGEAVRL
jgi:hypothetical protein